MKGYATCLDRDPACDKIDQQVGLGAGGQPEFFLKDTRGLFEGGRIVYPEVGKCVVVSPPSRTGEWQEKGEQRAEMHG